MCECEIVTDLDNDCTKYKLLSMSKFMMDKSLLNNRLFKVTIHCTSCLDFFLDPSDFTCDFFLLDSTLGKIEEEWKPLEKKLRKVLKKLEGEEEMEEDNNEELIQDEESANR